MGRPGQTVGPGWGCDSNKDVSWQPSPTAATQLVPSCVPDYGLDPALYPFGGAYKATPVNTFQRSWTGWMEPVELEALMPAGDPAARRTAGQSARCSPSVGTPPAEQPMRSEQVITDAQAGTLPASASLCRAELAAQRGFDAERRQLDREGGLARSSTAEWAQHQPSSSPMTTAAASTTTFRRPSVLGDPCADGHRQPVGQARI